MPYPDLANSCQMYVMFFETSLSSYLHKEGEALEYKCWFQVCKTIKFVDNFKLLFCLDISMFTKFPGYSVVVECWSESPRSKCTAVLSPGSQADVLLVALWIVQVRSKSSHSKCETNQSWQRKTIYVQCWEIKYPIPRKLDKYQ